MHRGVLNSFQRRVNPHGASDRQPARAGSKSFRVSLRSLSMMHGGVPMKPSNPLPVILLAFALLLEPCGATAEDWPMYGRDLKHTFTNHDTLIGAGNVATLLPAWSF